MNKHGFQIGPGAASLLLIAVALSMSVMGILNLVSARNDERLSARSAEVTEAVYSLNSAAEAHLAELDAVLAGVFQNAGDDYLAQVENALGEPFCLTDDTVTWEETDADGRCLSCAVRLLPPGGEARYEWTDHRLLTDAGDDSEEFFD